MVKQPRCVNFRRQEQLLPKTPGKGDRLLKDNVKEKALQDRIKELECEVEELKQREEQALADAAVCWDLVDRVQCDRDAQIVLLEESNNIAEVSKREVIEITEKLA